MERLIRKYQNSLLISGGGVILFGVWNIARICFIYFFAGDLLIDVAKSGVEDPTVIDDADMALVKLVLLIIILIVFFIDLIFRIYLGRCAAKEAKGEKKSCVYIVIAAIMLVIALQGDIVALATISESASKVETFFSAIVDISSCYALGDMIYSSLRLRYIMKKAEGKEVEYAG